MKNRRNLTPPMGVPMGEVHATRRGGARREVSARVTLRPLSAPLSASGPAKVLEGWALNVSRGGVRVILEETVEPGTHFEVTLIGGGATGGTGAEPPSTHVGRVVWIQQEPDGVVAGIEFRSEADKP